MSSGLPRRRLAGRCSGIAFSLAVGLAATAEAHLVTTGLGPVYDGVSHLLLSLEDLLVVAGVAMLAGLGGAACGRRALLVLPAAWLASGWIGQALGAPPVPRSATALSLLLTGSLIALGRPLRPGWIAALALLTGLVHGSLNGADLAAADMPVRALLGIAAAVFVLVALVAAPVCRVRAAWARVAVRVAGSWLAAVGLLMAGWALRGVLR